MKNIRNFVCAASLLLAVWLGLTFVSKVPSHRYPTLGKQPAPVSEASSGATNLAAAPAKSGLATVPVAR